MLQSQVFYDPNIDDALFFDDAPVLTHSNKKTYVKTIILPNVISGLISWLRSDKLVTLSSGKVSAWGDQSGNGNSVSQAISTQQPTYVASGGLNNLPYLNCGLGVIYNELTFPANAFSALTAAECFLVYKRTATNTPGGLYHVGSASNSQHVPYADSFVYDSFGAATRHDHAGIITYGAGNYFVPTLYNVSAGFNSWANRFNGTLLAGSSTNTISFATAQWLLASQNADKTTVFFEGQFYEWLMFNRILTAEERSQINVYVYDRYGIIGV